MTTYSFEECYEKITTTGWLDKDEAELLFNTAKSTKGSIVEVGSYQGRSAMLLVQLGRPLHCIDPWDDYFHSSLKGEEIYQRFQEHMQGLAEICQINWTCHRKPVEQCDPIPAGFVYLDGDHSYQGTINQVKWALLCKPQIIAIHDVNNSGEGLEVKRAATELLGMWQRRVNRLAIWRVARS